MTNEPGTPLPGFRVDCLSADTMKAWSRFLRDPNPIHLDRDSVRAAGLGDRLVNQGPMTLAYVYEMLSHAFPGGRVEDLQGRFLDNAYEDETLEITGSIDSVEEDGRSNCTFEVRADGRLCLSGTAVVAAA